jgi:Eukaryotic aspartyl protease
VDAIPPPKSVPLDGAPNLAKQATVDLTDYMSGTLDVLYYARMQFGTPAQTLTIDIDTGSADLWVSLHSRLFVDFLRFIFIIFYGMLNKMDSKGSWRL